MSGNTGVFSNLKSINFGNRHFTTYPTTETQRKSLFKNETILLMRKCELPVKMTKTMITMEGYRERESLFLFGTL